MKSRSHGFPSGSLLGATLVEVVVTVGILAAALVPLLGLLSAAIDMSGKATSSAISASISARLVSEVQQSDWAGLQSWNDRELYFDDQGIELTEVQAPAKAVYIASVALGPEAGISMSAAGMSNPFLRMVVVLVTSRSLPHGKADLDEAKSAIAKGRKVPTGVRVSRAMLVNLEKQPGS